MKTSTSHQNKRFSLAKIINLWQIIFFLGLLTFFVPNLNGQELKVNDKEEENYIQFSCSDLPYSISIPAINWFAHVENQTFDSPEFVIIEKIHIWSINGVDIFIDIWKTNPEYSLEYWISNHTSILTNRIEEMTQTNISGKEAYNFRSSDNPNETCIQSHDFEQTYLKYNDLVFRVHYTEINFGTSKSEYDHILKSFSFIKAERSIGDMKFESHKDDYRYNCGGFNGSDCGGSNPYPCCSYNGNSNSGNCTWWAWRAARCGWGISLPSPWRNAKYWAGDLAANGYTVSTTPSVNSIACSDVGSYGHVAWVTSYSATRIYVTEMNCGSMNGMRAWDYSTSFFNKGYITPPVNLKLNSAISYSPNPIVQNQPLSVTVSIKNTSTQTFSGQLTAALHSTGGTYLGDIEIKSNVSIAGNASNTFTFTKSQISSVPGTYRIYLKSKPTNGSWSDINPGSYSNPITVTIVMNCLPPSGGYANNVTKNSARINWNLVNGAQNIKLEYKKTSASSWTVLTLPGNYYYNVLTGLQANTNYVVRLKTVCSSTSSSSYSANITFKTSTTYKNSGEEQQISATEFDVKFFPNPSKGFINLEIYNTSESIDVIITNLFGQICINEKISTPFATIDATNLPKGLYTIIFKNKEMRKVEKIIIE